MKRTLKKAKKLPVTVVRKKHLSSALVLLLAMSMFFTVIAVLQPELKSHIAPEKKTTTTLTGGSGQWYPDADNYHPGGDGELLAIYQGYDDYTQVRWNLTADGIPANATITGAWFHAYVTTLYTCDINFYHGPAINWTEPNVPARPSDIGSQTPIYYPTPSGGNQFYNYTITSIVQYWFHTTGSAYLHIESPSPTGEVLWWSDAHAGTVDDPYIVVTWSLPLHWAPTFTSTPVTTVTVGMPYSYAITLNESSTLTIFLNGSELPGSPVNGLYASYGNSTIYGRPVNPASYNVAIAAVSVAGTLTAWQNFSLVVSTVSWVAHFDGTPPTNWLTNHTYVYDPLENTSAFKNPAWTIRWHSNSTLIPNGSYFLLYGNGPVWYGRVESGSMSWGGSSWVFTPGVIPANATGVYDIMLRAQTNVTGAYFWQNFTLTITTTPPPFSSLFTRQVHWLTDTGVMATLGLIGFCGMIFFPFLAIRYRKQHESKTQSFVGFIVTEMVFVGLFIASIGL